MKLLKRLFFISLVILSCLSLAGCGAKEVSSAVITRDDERIGGSLSFVYDSHEKAVYIGGEGEFIQYYEKSLERNWKEGNRVGLKITAPKEVTDISKTTLEMNGVTFADLGAKVNGEAQNFFNIYPTITETTREIKFKVSWDEETKAQEYKVIIVEGTKLLNKDGTESVEIKEK